MKINVYVNKTDFKKALKKGNSCYLNCSLEMNIKYTKKIKNVRFKDIKSENIYDLKVWMELED